MNRGLLRALLWFACSAALLCAGFLALLAVGALMVRSQDPDAARQLPMALAIYARVVLLKGLLPAVAMTFLLWPLIERVFSLARRGRVALALGVFTAAAIASTAVAGLLLPSGLWGTDSVRYAGIANFLQSCAEMTAGVGAAVLISRWLVGSEARIPVWLSGVAVACIAAGFLLPRPVAEPSPMQPAPAAPTGESTGPTAEVPAPTPPAAPGDAPQDYPATTLPLDLLATKVDELESKSSAVIIDLGDLVVATLHIGDTFANHPKARLDRIEVGRVLIDNEGRIEQLVVGSNPARLADRFGFKKPDPESVEFQRQSLERIRERIDNPPEPILAEGGLLAEGKPTPIYEGDQLVAIELDGVRRGGFYDRIGLRNGDRVRTINGVQIGTPGAFEAVRTALTTAPRFDIAVQRHDGRVETVSVPTETLIRELVNLDPKP